MLLLLWFACSRTDPIAEAVREVALTHAADSHACYNALLRENPDLVGSVDIGWTLAEGKVVETWVRSNDSGSADLASCLEKEVKTWVFPAELDGSAHRVFSFTTNR